jgi:transporter family-2 protein
LDLLFFSSYKNMILYYFLAFIAGICISTQAGINSQLKQAVGNPFLASLFSFVIGSLALFLFSIFTPNFSLPEVAILKNISWWKWTGGILGAVYVTAVIVSAPKIGAANLIGFIVAGQMILAVFLDNFGLIGFQVHSLSLIRFAGVITVILGVFLIQKF